MKIRMAELGEQYLSIREEVDRAIGEVLARATFIKGPEVELLERELAARLGVRHCIGCGNGTDALHLALMTIDLQPGDEVICPAFAFAAAVEAVLLAGGVPVLADVDARDFNLDPASAERLITPRTKAIIPVHLFGQPCRMEELARIAARHGLAIIEDNAQSLGAECRWSTGNNKAAGSIGRVSCTSFFPTKVLGCFGDGGALFTDDDALAARLRSLSSHGQQEKYRHTEVGINSRLDTLQAAVLRAKLPHLDAWTEARCTAAARYTAALEEITEVEPPVVSPCGTHVWHQYTIKVPAESRDALRQYLAGEQIDSMIYYPAPLYEQPAYRDRCVCDPQMKHAGELSRCVLSLPMHGGLTAGQQRRVTDTIRKFYEKRSE